MRLVAKRRWARVLRGASVALLLCTGSTVAAQTGTISGPTQVPLSALDFLYLNEFKVTGPFTSIGGAAGYTQNQKYVVTAVLQNKSREDVPGEGRTYLNISFRIVPKSTCTQLYTDSAYTKKIARFDPFVPSLAPGQTHPRFTFYMIFTCASSLVSAQLFEIGVYADWMPRIKHWTTLDGNGVRH